MVYSVLYTIVYKTKCKTMYTRRVHDQGAENISMGWVAWDQGVNRPKYESDRCRNVADREMTSDKTDGRKQRWGNENEERKGENK